MSQDEPSNDPQHTERVDKELQETGAIPLGMKHFITTYLPHVIHKDEHIKAAIFGRHTAGEGLFGMIESALVATDLRVIFINHNLGYTTMDEFSYQTISGVNVSTTLFNASVTLYTRVSNYLLSFVSLESAQKFSDYIEFRLEGGKDPAPEPKEQNPPPYEESLGAEALEFLKSHEIGVLSSIERTGTPHGAAIYYTVKDDYIYFLTKEVTRKAGNIAGNEHIAFTVFDEQSIETIQLSGIAESVTDEEVRTDIIGSLLRPRTYKDGSSAPPVVRMGVDTPLIYRILITNYNYTNFSKLPSPEPESDSGDQ